MCLLITCETGGTNVPAWLSTEARASVAETFTGDDLHRRSLKVADGPARYAAQRMAEYLGADLILNEYSNELIDVTQTLDHRQLFSQLTRAWSKDAREQLVELVYRPYQERVRASVETLLSVHGFAIHLSVRSFNLRNRGVIRRTDVGLLYDTTRQDEVDFCVDWLNSMWEGAPMLKVRRNYPQRGATVGPMQSFRTKFAAQDYMGVGVWLNRAWAGRKVAIRDEAIGGICGALVEILEEGTEVQSAAA